MSNNNEENCHFLKTNDSEFLLFSEFTIYFSKVNKKQVLKNNIIYLFIYLFIYYRYLQYGIVYIQTLFLHLKIHNKVFMVYKIILI
jgi:hypothetical protein